MPVILFHFNNELLPGGFIGVDVFFVISGFLITSIILNEYERGVFSFSDFWLRRVRRILPALTAMVLTTLLVGMFVLYSPDLESLGSQGIASLLSFANISHWLIAGNYWGQAAESSPLLHTWSLSVEEQFYLIFPLLLVIALRYFHKRVVFIFFFLSLSSVLLFFYGTQTRPSATFYLIPTRAWELGVGALMSILFFQKRLPVNKKPILAAIGFLAVLLSYFFISGKDGISPFLVIPVVGAVLTIVYTKDTDNTINRILSASPIIYIGKISYSLYLWHWPVLVLLRQLSLKYNADVNSIFVLAVVFIISVLSYNFIEVPTRKNKKTAPYIISVLLVGVAFSYLLKISDFSENTSFYNLTKWDGNLYNVNPHKEWPDSKRMMGITVSNSDSIDVNAYSNGGIKRLYGTKKPEIVVLGDSHALMWASVLDEVAKELGKSISFYSADGTPPFFSIPVIKKKNGTMFFSADQKFAFDRARLKHLQEWKPKLVVIVARWSSSKDIQENRDLIKYIGDLGSRILFIEQPPELFFGDKNTPQYLSYLGLTPQNSTKQYIRHKHSTKYQNGIELVKMMVKTYEHCHRVATSDLFLLEGKVWVIDSFDVLYIDDDHLSYAGALKAKDRIVTAINELLE